MSRRDQPFVDIDALEAATAGLPAPLVVVDLDAFDANAADLVRRAAGRPIRVASKSVRCRSLLRRVLDRPGFAGVMAYAVPEAVWLVRQGFTDVFVAYPSVDREWLQTLATDEQLREEISVAGTSRSSGNLGNATAGTTKTANPIVGYDNIARYLSVTHKPTWGTPGFPGRWFYGAKSLMMYKSGGYAFYADERRPAEEIYVGWNP